eukprot:scaffold15018_cov202-Isochrysis_galbana.AAC.1
MPGGARSRRTIDCAALVGRYARCPPAPAAQGPHPALGPHPRQVLRATEARHALPVSRNFVILTPLRPPYQVSIRIRCAIFNFVFWRLDARRGGHRGVAAVRAGYAVTRGVFGDR